MLTSLPYIVPPSATQRVQGDWTFVPLVSWPSHYPTPNFAHWRRTGRKSSVRNLTALMLSENRIPNQEIEMFLGLSSSRRSSIVRMMSVRLFGKDHKDQKQKLYTMLVDATKRHDSTSFLDYLQNRLENFEFHRMQAVLAAISRMELDVKDNQLFHFAIELMKRNSVVLDLKAYEDAA